MLKRSPEKYIKTFTEAFKLLKGDLSKIVSSKVLSVIVPHLRAADEKVRKYAIKSFSVLIENLQDVHSCKEIVKELFDVLNGNIEIFIKKNTCHL